MSQPATGRMLVATPVLTEPTFHRTVILLIAHGSDGAAGLVLNREADVPLLGVLPEWAPLACEPRTVFAGGPVASEAAICLARLQTGRPEGWAPIAGTGLGTLDLGGSPSVLSPSVAELRVYAGYAGWAPGQLEDELAQSAWVVVDSRAQDVFTVRPDTLWLSVLRRQPGLVAALATYPPDATLN